MPKSPPTSPTISVLVKLSFMSFLLQVSISSASPIADERSAASVPAITYCDNWLQHGNLAGRKCTYFVFKGRQGGFRSGAHLFHGMLESRPNGLPLPQKFVIGFGCENVGVRAGVVVA